MKFPNNIEKNIMFKKILFYTAILTVIILIGCSEENQSLVNPPPQTATVKVRFLNLAQDKKTRKLNFEDKAALDTIEYANYSTAINPPADSTYLYIQNQNIIEFKTSRRQRFIRNTNYTFIALPSPKSNSQKAVDTMIYFSTTPGLEELKNSSWLKFVNAYPDSTLFATLIQGCPSGTKLFSSLAYRAVGSNVEVQSGELKLSLITSPSNAILEGLYVVNLVPNYQYTIILYENAEGNPALALIDELSYNSNELISLNKLPESDIQTKIRAINFSNEPVRVKKIQYGQDDELIENLPKDKIGSFIDVDACSSSSLDSIAIFTTNQMKSVASISLNVKEKYSIMTFDSASSIANLAVIAEPLRNPATSSEAVVRVVNAVWNDANITVSMGARSIDNVTLGFKSGDVLASDLNYGSVSGDIAISPGVMPITIFSATQPAKLKFCTNANFEAGKNYLLIIYKTKLGEIKATLINDDEANKSIDYLEKGVFVELVNLIPQNKNRFYSLVSMSPLLNNDTLYNSFIIATVVKAGVHSVDFDGHSYSFNADPNKRVVIIAAGDENNIEFLEFQSLPIEVASNSYVRKFINACKEHKYLSISENASSNYAAENLEYGAATSPITVTIAQKVSYLFYKTNDTKPFFQISDLILAFGKNYSVILGGNSSKGYSVVVLQEY